MKYLQIKNQGELEIQLVALMGGTTKANDKFKIGQFGTGLKYVLAYLIRNNLHFKIFSGETECIITTETEVIRKERFEIICIDGNRTSITTRMGLEWKAWMIIRELWCNALDEGEQAKNEITTFEPVKGETHFYIQIDSNIQKVLDSWDKFFIHDKKPMFEDDRFAIYPNNDKLKIYKHGVLIKANKTTSLFSYDIKGATINELREYQGSLNGDITQALTKMDKKTATYFLEQVENPPEDDYYFESKMDLDFSWLKLGEGWKEAIGDAKLITQKHVDDIKARGLDIDMVGMIVVPKNVYKKATQQMKGIGALRVASANNEFYETFSPEAEQKVKEALVILETCNYTIHPELKFTYGHFGNKNRLASVNMDTAEVFVDVRAAERSLFDVVGMLIEESEHFDTGHQDCSREFQQHFIDKYVHALLSKHKIQL